MGKSKQTGETRWGRGKDRDGRYGKSGTQHSHRGCDSSEGWAATPTEQTRGAEIAMRPEQPAHVKAGPTSGTEKWFKGSQCSTACHHETKDSTDVGTHSPFFSLCPALQ